MLKNNEVYARAIKEYGTDIQMFVALEELAELSKEISKYMRYKDNKKQILEEMADVSIMLEQLKIIVGIYDNELEDEVKFKTLRLNERLNELKEEL